MLSLTRAFEDPHLDDRNVQKLACHQTLLYPRDMNTWGPIPLPGGLELLDLFHVLHQNIVILDRLAGGVFHVAYRFNMISTHREDDTGKFPRGFVLPVVLSVNLRRSLVKTVRDGDHICTHSFETLGFPRREKLCANAQNRLFA